MACYCLHNFVLDEQIFEPLNMPVFLRDHPLDDDHIEDDDDIDFELENEAEIRRDELAGYFVHVGIN